MKEDIPKAVRIGGKGAPRIPPKKRTQTPTLESTLLPFKKDLMPLNINNCMLFTEPPLSIEKPTVRVLTHKKKAPYAYIISGESSIYTEPKNEVLSSTPCDIGLKDEVLDDLRDKIDCLDRDETVEDEVVEIDVQIPKQSHMNDGNSSNALSNGNGQSDEIRINKDQAGHTHAVPDRNEPKMMHPDDSGHLSDQLSELPGDIDVNFHGFEKTRAGLVGDEKVVTRETMVEAAVEDKVFQAQIVDTKEVTLSKGRKGGESVNVVNANIAHAEGPDFEVNIAEIHTSAKDEESKTDK